MNAMLIYPAPHRSLRFGAAACLPKRRVVYDLLCVLFHCTDALALLRSAIGNAVAVFGLVIPLENEISLAVLTFFCPHVKLKHLLKLQKQYFLKRATTVRGRNRDWHNARKLRYYRIIGTHSPLYRISPPYPKGCSAT